MNRLNHFRQPLRYLLNLLLVGACPLCQRPARQTVCLDCQRQLHHCQFAATDRLQLAPLPIFAWGQYEGTLKRAIAAFKYDSHPELARPLAQELAQAWLNTANVPARLTVVPIPIHASKLQQRGFNQADLLATQFCEVTRFPLAIAGLMRSRETAAQFGLSREQRTHNVRDAFRLGQAFQKRRPTSPVLLLDDIYTTGATAQAATQILRCHGISVYGMAVVARTRPLGKREIRI